MDIEWHIPPPKSIIFTSPGKFSFPSRSIWSSNVAGSTTYFGRELLCGRSSLVSIRALLGLFSHSRTVFSGWPYKSGISRTMFPGCKSVASMIRIILDDRLSQGFTDRHDRFLVREDKPHPVLVDNRLSSPVHHPQRGQSALDQLPQSREQNESHWDL